ncbi:MAG: LL-diaminopimelate aminotransferase [Candidatus Aerophobetes bacterium]|nr:LL-diaminopimelate aminotransferase [Candidatus Aerophobetes bacterium]
MNIKIEKAERLKQLPPYLFARLDKVKRKLKEEGKDVIDLGIGDPDLPTPSPIIKRLCQAAKNPKNHRYPSYEGLFFFRQSVSQWYRERFGVKLDPENEILTLIGSKEGIAHTPLALINPGDFALIPDPGYPVYKAGVIFAGGRPFQMSLREENHFLPSLREIDKEIAQKAKILFINYPNNPTAATATRDFFQEVINFAKEFNIIVCHDLAYSEIFFDRHRPLSFLEVERAKEIGVEFHSLSKTFNMTGWRIGFIVGNQKVIQALGEVKTNIDSGVFQAVQEAATEALKMDEEIIQKTRQVYQKRRDVLIKGLKEIGWKVKPPQATFYVWAKIPGHLSSLEFAGRLLKECGVVVTPGIGFGSYGEGYVRIALTTPEARIKEAMHRIKKSKTTNKESLKCRD